MRYVWVALLWCGLLAWGQEGRILPVPPGSPVLPVPVYKELKDFLALSDQQMQRLVEIQRTRLDAARAVYEQIGQKQMALNGLLRQNTTDALAVGRLMLDIEALRKQIPTSAEPYRSSALGVLNNDQKTKLAMLESALKLQGAAFQAVGLNLLASPAVVAAGRVGFFGVDPSGFNFSFGAEQGISRFSPPEFSGASPPVEEPEP